MLKASVSTVSVLKASIRSSLRCGLPVVLAATGLTGCFTSTADFKSNAEDYIIDKVSTEVGAEFVSVNCDEPVDQNIDTRFMCQAIDTADQVWEFDNVIDGDGEFTINISRRP